MIQIPIALGFVNFAKYAEPIVATCLTCAQVISYLRKITIGGSKYHGSCRNIPLKTNTKQAADLCRPLSIQ